jgi:hypothetical protein
MMSVHAQGGRNPLPEKEVAMHVERSANGLSLSDDEFLSNFSAEDRRKCSEKYVRDLFPIYCFTCWMLSSLSIGRCSNTLPNSPARQLMRRQLRLMPMLVLLYLFADIDKTNIGRFSGLECEDTWLTMPGNAKIEGLLPSLGMSGDQYNIALAIFFIFYVLAGMSFLSTTETH